MSNTIRVNFSSANEAQITEGIGRLGRLIGRMASERSAA